MQATTIVLLGRPGSGKGTQATLLAQELSFRVFSTGSRMRELAKEDTPLGRKVKSIIDQGLLTPYWFASYVFEHEVLNLPPEEGLVFEGVARTEGEARLFHEVMEWLGRSYAVFYLDVPESVIVERLRKRAQHEDRADDAEAHLRTRFTEYETKTVPAIGFFRSMGAVVEVDGNRPPEAIVKDLLAHLS